MYTASLRKKRSFRLRVFKSRSLADAIVGALRPAKHGGQKTDKRYDFCLVIKTKLYLGFMPATDTLNVGEPPGRLKNETPKRTTCILSSFGTLSKTLIFIQHRLIMCTPTVLLL